MLPVFVRHGLSLPDPDSPSESWALDPKGYREIEKLAELLPAAPVVCSDMRRAIETAAFFGTPVVDVRLREVSRPFVDNLERVIGPYFAGHVVQGWEPQHDAVARFEACTNDHGESIYVTHGTIMSLYMKARYPALDAFTFWANLRSPDAWSTSHAEPSRVG